MSRQVIRSLNASQMLSINDREESFYDAVQKVRTGKVMGFFYIPENFEKDALGGRTPTLSYYCNLTYYVPGSLAFKGFKTVAVTTKGGMVQTKLISAGMDGGEVSSMLQPVVIDQHPIGNPWPFNLSDQSYRPGSGAQQASLHYTFQIRKRLAQPASHPSFYGVILCKRGSRKFSGGGSGIYHPKR